MQLEDFVLKTNVLAFASRSKAKKTTKTFSCKSIHKNNLCQKIIRPSFTQCPRKKKLSTLLRHGHLPRKEDETIEFWRLKNTIPNTIFGCCTCVPGSSSLAVTQDQGSAVSWELQPTQIDSGALKDLGVGEVAAPTVSGGSQVAECSCLGRHRAACPRSGRLRRRAVAPEKTLARVCRKAGATKRCNAKLREMKVVVNR